MTTTEHERVQLLLHTRQVREFTDEPLTGAELEALTDVARWSGSSRNNQPWRFIVIRDRAVIERIHVAGAPQTRSLRTARRPSRSSSARDPADLDDTYDEGRAAERMLIAAGLLGLAAGISWVGRPLEPWSAICSVCRPVGSSGRWSQSDIHRKPPCRPKSAPGDARLPASETVFEERWPQG